MDAFRNFRELLPQKLTKIKAHNLTKVRLIRKKVILQFTTKEKKISHTGVFSEPFGAFQPFLSLADTAADLF